MIKHGKLETNQEIYEIKQLSLHQLHEIMKLQDIVFEELEDKDTLQKLSKEEYINILGRNGFLLGTYSKGKLIAIRALLIPEIDEEHLGVKLGLKEEDLDKVIYQEISFVHPRYRGNGIQQKLATLIMEELTKSNSDFRYVCSTVAPFNIPSLIDKFKQGMRLRVLDRIYGEKLRYVFIKKLEEKDNSNWVDSKKVPIREIELQQKLLQLGWTGYEWIKEGQDYFIQFGK